MDLVEQCAGVESLLALGACALTYEGDLRAGREHYDAAYRQAQRVGDVEAMAEAALGIGGLWVHEHRSTAGAILLEERLRAALSLVDPGSPLALRLRIRLAGEADYRSGTPATILPLLDEARAYGDPVARAEALSIAHHCLLDPEYAALRRSLAAELVAESFRTGRRSDLLMGLLWQTVDLFLEADPHAGRRLGELRAQLTEEDHLAVGFVVDAIDVMLVIRTGDLDRAESLAKACLARGTDAGDVDATGWYGAQLVAIRWYQGRLVEVLPMLAELADSPTLSAIDNAFRSALGVAAALAGDRPAATSALAALCGNDLADLPRSSSWLVTVSGAVEAAYLLGDADTAARAYALLLPYADRPMVASIGAACFGSVHHALGVAALATGEVDRAVEHLGAAVRQNLALGHWPAVVASRHRLAEALTRRGEPADPAESQRQLATAAQEAGARGSVDDVAASCIRQGRYWRVALGHRSVLVEHRIGMLHLAVLLANPGREIDAIDLAAGPAALDAGDGSIQPVLDRAAVRAYRDRLTAIRHELETGHDTERARAERDWLVAELAGATGLGGRTRAFSGNRERARIAVGKAIRRAVEHVAKADPVVGDHLAGAVHTGMQCAYHVPAWNGMERPSR
jgi:hypothetical protein